MNTAYLVSHFADAANILNKCLTYGSSDYELASFLSSYLVVFLSGIYEDCFEYLLVLRGGKSGDPEVESFVKTAVNERFRNPKWENLLTVLGWFSKEYVDQLRRSVVEQDRLALNNIVNNKNYIAHGQRSQLTLQEVESFHLQTLHIFEELEKILF